MKRRDLIRHVEAHGCKLLREGGQHSVYINRAAQRISTIPLRRHLAFQNCSVLCIYPHFQACPMWPLPNDLPHRWNTKRLLDLLTHLECYTRNHFTWIL